MHPKDLSRILLLPNKNHSVKEAVITLFFEQPIVNLHEFDSFYHQNLSSIFDKKEAINKVNLTIDSNSIKSTNEPNSGFKLYRVTNDKTDLLVQLVNDTYRQYLSFHCLQYKRWEDFKMDFNSILAVLEKWVNNKVVAFSLNYIDEFSCKDGEIPLDLVFRKNSDFLPKRIFNSQSSFLVFNTENNSTSKHFDRIELKVQNNIVSISHNSVIPLDNPKNFNNFGECSDKLDWAHDNNKSLLKDILSTPMQKIIKLYETN